jgi:hypothetical protein
MTIEERIQQALGQLVFSTLILHDQLEKATADVARLTPSVDDPKKSKKP